MLRALALILGLASGSGLLVSASGGLLVSASGQVPDEQVVHVLNRLAYGPRPGDVERVKAVGLQKWIEMQLAPARIDDRTLDAKLQRLATLTLDSETILRDYAGPAMEERRRRQLENPNAPPPDPSMMPRGQANDVQRKAR